MILSEMQTELLAMLGNIPSSHRLYPLVYPAAGHERTSIILRAANRLIRTRIGPNVNDAEMFPELARTSWTVGPMIVGGYRYQRPADCNVLQGILSAGQATLPDWSATSGLPLNIITDPKMFDILPKAGAAYASLYTFSGRWIKYNPATDVDHIDYHKLFGIMGERPMSAPTDTLIMHEDWHPIVVTLSGALMASKLGWAARAQTWYNEAMQEMQSASNPTRMQLPQHFDIEVEGMPDWSSVNGEGG